jgi:enoyl-CoA hydratase
MTAHVLTRVANRTGIITLDRPKALNSLSLDMVRAVTATLLAWRDDAGIDAVVIGSTSEKALCAGGDIRFFHEAGRATPQTGSPLLEDFFTEEYALNHLIHFYPKPYIALMDGVVMGGGMGISQGAKLRVLTEHSKLAMPETNIGLFPDVGGGYFLSRCPGHSGEWLALTGQVIGAGDAIELGLGDVFVRSSELPAIISAFKTGAQDSAEHVVATVMERVDLAPVAEHWNARALINRHFSAASVPALFASLAADADPWAQQVLATLGKRSPLMMAVTLEQIRRARAMSLADDLRMERDLVHHCFHLRPGAASETVEGVRALAVDKDHAPKWNPARVEDVCRADVEAFFRSPWPAAEHPLRALD